MMRAIDDPKHKERIIAQLYGEFIGYLNAQGLTNGNEYAGTVQEFFSCSKRYIHIFDKDDSKELQLVVFLDSTQFCVMFGIANKKKKETIYKKTIENLRYNISIGSDIELIDSHKQNFNELFEDFKTQYKKLEVQQ